MSKVRTGEAGLPDTHFTIRDFATIAIHRLARIDGHVANVQFTRLTLPVSAFCAVTRSLRLSHDGSGAGTHAVTRGPASGGIGIGSVTALSAQ